MKSLPCRAVFTAPAENGARWLWYELCNERLEIKKEFAYENNSRFDGRVDPARRRLRQPRSFFQHGTVVGAGTGAARRRRNQGCGPIDCRPILPLSVGSNRHSLVSKRNGHARHHDPYSPGNVGRPGRDQRHLQFLRRALHLHVSGGTGTVRCPGAMVRPPRRKASVSSWRKRMGA